MIQEFVDCFVRYEERTREETDDDGNTTEETYLVAVPLTSQTEIYCNIRSRLRAVNDMDQANAIEIYYRMVYGVAHPRRGMDSGNGLNGRGPCRLKPTRLSVVIYRRGKPEVWLCSLP